MTNWDQAGAWREYHEATRNDPDAAELVRPVSPALVPGRFKLYRGLEAIPLPPPLPVRAPVERLALQALSTLLHYSAGILRPAVNGRPEFRAAACTGGLYHIELYLVCGPLPGLEAGVYHFAPAANSLERLRSGDFRPAVAGALCLGAPLCEAYLVCSSTFWRNAWRYEARAYRHVFWDNGTILANLLALANDHGLQASVYSGFIDSDLNLLLGIDGRREAALSAVALGPALSPLCPGAAVEELKPAVEPASAVEIEYPAISRLHRLSGLRDCSEVERWLAASTAGRRTDPDGAPTFSRPVEEVIVRRGSARRFSRRAVTRSQLQYLLAAAAASPLLDFLPLVDIYVLANDVADLRPGAYRYEADSDDLILVNPLLTREQAAHLALDQSLAAEAAVCVYFLGSSSRIDLLGNRGYRSAQLQAGIAGGNVYLAAYDLGLRASGLTFYDDPVSKALGPLPAEAHPVLFQVVAGP